MNLNQTKLFYLRWSLPLILAVFVSGCQRGQTEESIESVQEKSTLLEISPEAVENLRLEFAIAEAVDLRQEIRIQGEVVLSEERMALVPARISGILERAPVRVGQDVVEGERLAVLSSQELADRIMGYVDTEWAFRAAMKMIERERALNEREISSAEQLLEAEQAYRRAENAHSVALQRLRLLGYAEKDLHQYLERSDLQDLTVYEIRAPMSGRVLEKHFQVGTSIEPGQTLFKLGDLKHLNVRFDLPLRHMNSVAEDLPIMVVNEGLDFRSEAVITIVESQMDPRSRTVPVRADLPNPDLAWRPGMPARIEIDGLPTHVGCGIPQSAVHEVDGRTGVFVEVNPGKFVFTTVTLGRQDANLVEVVHGLQPGDRVVSKNSFLLASAWQGGE